jgi:5-methylcytosine-specific restriction endonuclease McrA
MKCMEANMARCNRTWGLEVHHKRRDGGNGIDNAEVLCKECHAATSTYGITGKSPEPFSQETKDKALKRAGNRCECTKTGGCH